MPARTMANAGRGNTFVHTLRALASAAAAAAAASAAALVVVAAELLLLLLLVKSPRQHPVTRTTLSGW